MRPHEIVPHAIVKGPAGWCEVIKIMDIGGRGIEVDGVFYDRRAPFEVSRVTTGKNGNRERIVVTMKRLLGKQGQAWMFLDDKDHLEYEAVYVSQDGKEAENA